MVDTPTGRCQKLYNPAFCGILKCHFAVCHFFDCCFTECHYSGCCHTKCLWALFAYDMSSSFLYNFKCCRRRHWKVKTNFLGLFISISLFAFFMGAALIWNNPGLEKQIHYIANFLKLARIGGSVWCPVIWWNLPRMLGLWNGGVYLW